MMHIYGPKAFDIAGYTWQAENYRPADLIAAMVASGELSPAARDMDVEHVLDQHAGALAIDRMDERSFDSDEFPKVIFWSQVTDDDTEWLEPPAFRPGDTVRYVGTGEWRGALGTVQRVREESVSVLWSAGKPAGGIGSARIADVERMA